MTGGHIIWRIVHSVDETPHISMFVMSAVIVPLLAFEIEAAVAWSQHTNNSVVGLNSNTREMLLIEDQQRRKRE